MLSRRSVRCQNEWTREGSHEMFSWGLTHSPCMAQSAPGVGSPAPQGLAGRRGLLCVTVVGVRGTGSRGGGQRPRMGHLWSLNLQVGDRVSSYLWPDLEELRASSVNQSPAACMRAELPGQIKPQVSEGQGPGNRQGRKRSLPLAWWAHPVMGAPPCSHTDGYIFGSHHLSCVHQLLTLT